jgi:hypothetical protein
VTSFTIVNVPTPMSFIETISLERKSVRVICEMCFWLTHPEIWSMNYIESRVVASCESESLRLSLLLVLWRFVANLTSDKIISIATL